MRFDSLDWAPACVLRPPGMILAGAIMAHAAPLSAQAAALSSAVRAFVTVDAPIVALTHVRVVDGTGAPPADDQTLVIGKVVTVFKNGVGYDSAKLITSVRGTVGLR